MAAAMEKLIRAIVLTACLAVAGCSAQMPPQASLMLMNDTAEPVTVTISYRAGNDDKRSSFTLDAGRGDLWQYNQNQDSSSVIGASIIGVEIETPDCSHVLNHQQLESAVESNGAHHLLTITPIILNCISE